jgi:hypothetical protein
MDLNTKDVICLAVFFAGLLAAAIVSTRRKPSPLTVRTLTAFRNAQNSWNNASAEERKNLLFVANAEPDQHLKDLSSLDWSALPLIVQDSLTESSLRNAPP